MIHYVCKYTPVELFKGFGEDCAVLEEMPENFELSDKIAHANLCGFGKSVIQAVLEGKVENLVLVNCCDSMRRVYDIVESTGKCKFLYLLDLPHEDNECEKVKFAQAIGRLKQAYERFSGKTFDKTLFLQAFEERTTEPQPYIGVMGVRVSGVLEQMIQDNIRMRDLPRRKKADIASGRIKRYGRRCDVSCLRRGTFRAASVFSHEQQHKKKSVVSGPEPERHYLSYHQVL